MGYANNWTDLPKDLLVDVAHRLSFLEEFIRFTAVCKSWKSAAEAHKPFWLPTRCPMLLLAEDVAPGGILFNNEYTNTDEEEEEEEEEEDEEEDEEEEEEEEEEEDEDEEYDDDGFAKDFHIKFFRWKASYDYLKNSIGSSRGLYSLLSMRTYNMELPEAAGRLILGTNKGWLVMLGRDLQINLLHPLLRHQFPLPPMLTFPRQYKYHENYTPEEASDLFIKKVAMSSQILTCNTDVSLFHHCTTPSPIVMAIYGELDYLGFARLGDKVWTDVNVPSRCFQDIIYHKGSFYAVDNQGDVYVCCIDDDKESGGPRGTKIASLECDSCYQKYLVEPLSGSGLLLLVRYNKVKHIEHDIGIQAKYHTTDFSIWRLDMKYHGSVETPSCTLTEENNLGNAAIFIGRASSLSVSSSAVIKSNCIYFTDDNRGFYSRRGGGHDMGIFDIERGTIEPHFQGKSIHPISPPLWYI